MPRDSSLLRAHTEARFAPLTGSCVACRERNATTDRLCDQCRASLAREYPDNPGELPTVDDWHRMLDRDGIPR